MCLNAVSYRTRCGRSRCVIQLFQTLAAVVGGGAATTDASHIDASQKSPWRSQLRNDQRFGFVDAYTRISMKGEPGVVEHHAAQGG